MIRRFTRRAARLMRYTAADWRFPLYKAYVPFWRYRMARKGLDLTPATHEELGLAPELAHEYEDTEAPFLAAVLHKLKVGPGDAILDFGSGKGGALIVMSRFPFREIAGVDLAPKAVETARRNLSLLGLDRIALHCRDAAAFTDLDAFNCFYFFNPFPEPVMRRVLQNVKDSVERRPRNVTLIYCNPECHDLLAADPDIRVEWGYFHFNVYTLRPAHDREAAA